MRRVVGIIIILLGIVLALYVGGWLMFVKPIIIACVALNNGTLTVFLAGITIIKCLLASVTGVAIFYVSTVIGTIIALD